MLLFLLIEPASEEAEPKTSENQEVITTLDILEEQLGLKKEKGTEDNTSSKPKSGNNTNTTSQADVLVTEEMTKAFPSLKGLEGKPITAVAEQYQNMNKDYQGTKREMAEMRKQIELLSKTQSSTEKKPNEEEEETTIPDLLLDQEGFTNYLKKQSLSKEEVEQLVTNALKKREENQVQAKSKATEVQKNIVNAIVKEVPEGMNPLKAMSSYFSGNPDLMENGRVKPEILQFYSNNIKLFALTIGSYIKSSMSAEEINKRAKSEAYKHMKDNLVNAQEKKKANTDYIQPRTEEKLGEQDQLVSNIIENGYNPEDWEMPKGQ